jgi:ribosomal protein L11 methyltransferase
VSASHARVWAALDVSGLRPADHESAEARAERLHAALAAVDITAIDERTSDLWRIYFRDEGERERATATLRAGHLSIVVTPVDVPDEDWAARSQADLRAVRVGTLVIAPPWDMAEASAGARPGDRVICIQPSMGFGTGHHATTRLCLAALQRLPVAGRTVIDAGCGSGVLAVAASLLGGTRVVAFDEDPDAVQAAHDTLERNHGATVELIVASLGARLFAPADLVLANLMGGLLVTAAADLRALVVPGGVMVLSGLLAHEEAAVREALAGLVLERRDEQEGWLCLTLRAA